MVKLVKPFNLFHHIVYKIKTFCQNIFYVLKYFQVEVYVFRKDKVLKIMKRVLQEDLIYEILSVVEEIPEGSVATYGQIAKLIGRDKNARLVGKVLSMAEYYGEYPCHRVVNHAGRLVPGWAEQKFLLLQEGVTMKNENHVDLKKHLWNY